ncbi:hypothetical protein RFI_19638 [Reticulomyxa filosa]|uniref:Uncharacterized protein n=1 Tax=Reticulomyxa filosa TaxID=46433 RepID=X6MX65_RETFI|nr:hypothetical protein RFI_19638 [Reticulomyxa filosa]|eukprot:ETO17680.1 hypothetical protein RFI_19638 [Reticulomyxa filosa]
MYMIVQYSKWLLLDSDEFMELEELSPLLLAFPRLYAKTGRVFASTFRDNQSRTEKSRTFVPHDPLYPYNSNSNDTANSNGNSNGNNNGNSNGNNNGNEDVHLSLGHHSNENQLIRVGTASSSLHPMTRPDLQLKIDLHEHTAIPSSTIDTPVITRAPSDQQFDTDVNFIKSMSAHSDKLHPLPSLLFANLALAGDMAVSESPNSAEHAHVNPIAGSATNADTTTNANQTIANSPPITPHPDVTDQATVQLELVQQTTPVHGVEDHHRQVVDNGTDKSIVQ